MAQSAGGGLNLYSQTQPKTYPPSPLRVLPPKGDSKIALNCPPSEEVAQSAGGGLNLDPQTQPKTYPPSLYGDSLQRETKSSDNLSPLGGGSLQGGGGLSFNSHLNGVDNDTLRIYINPTQYFDKVHKIAWEFYIGGYQPAQKWLKDRKDQKLQFEDILHYQKIITTLTHTHQLMQEIEKIELE